MSNITSATPRLYSQPDRLYERDGTTIRCFMVSSAIKVTKPDGPDDIVLNRSVDPLYVLYLPNEECANLLMYDLLKQEECA